MIPETKPLVLMGPQEYSCAVPLMGINRSAPSRALNILEGWEILGLHNRDNHLVPMPGRVQVGGAVTGTIQAITSLTKYTTLTDTLVLTTLGLYRWSTDDWEAIDLPAEELGDDTLSGDTDFQVSFTFGVNTWIVTNGVDYVMTFDGTTLEVLTGGDDYQSEETYHHARLVRFFDSRLVLLNTIEDENEVFQRVRWGDFGSLTSFPSDNFYDLVDSPGAIMGAEQMGNYLVIYKKDSIVYMQPTGVATNPFYFTTESTGVGLLAQNSLVKAGEAHIFLGEALGTGINVFANVGGKIIPIGNKIAPLLREFVTRSTVQKCWGMWDTMTESFLLGVPFGEEAVSTLLIYETKGAPLDQGAWFMERVFQNVVCGGSALSPNYETIGDLVGTIGVQSWTMGSATIMGGYEESYLGFGTAVIKLDASSPLKEQNAVEGSFQTKAFNALDIDAPKGTKIRCLGVELVARKWLDSLLVPAKTFVGFSTDEGKTWEYPDNAVGVTLTMEMSRYRVDCDVTGDSIMFIFIGCFEFEEYLLSLAPRGRR